MSSFCVAIPDTYDNRIYLANDFYEYRKSQRMARLLNFRKSYFPLSDKPMGRRPANPNHWLEMRLEELKVRGKTKAGLAKALSLEPPRISEIVSGRREIASTEIHPMAVYLEWPDAVLLSKITGLPLREAALNHVMVVGSVQAGLWREALKWPEDEWTPAPVSPDPQFAGLEQFALEVAGPSMNELYPHGSFVVCVPYVDLGRDARPGEKVIVQRRSVEGLEATVKELRREPDGSYWLWPRSTDPNFQQPWRLHMDSDASENEDIRIVALVIGSYRRESAGR